MARTVGIGIQSFEKVIENNYMYIDKTDFIREWWVNGDDVTLITRPRRFGKTLTMDMVEKFFSVNYAGRSDLFEGLSVWREETYRKLQGTYPVISLSFANIKEKDYLHAREKIAQLIVSLYARHAFLLESGCLSAEEKEVFRRKNVDMGDVDVTLSLNQLSEYLCRYYGKKVIILLDEYDTPMQEAYVHGYWEELVNFIRSMFNAAFKTNPYLERAIMTGITRVSRESMFSDLNNLEVVTATSEKYRNSFGFTEEEVFAALDEFQLSEQKEKVKQWYDGFTFGSRKDIYNPWSIINFLSTGQLGTYWANSSSNRLAGKLIREGSREVKQRFEELLLGQHLFTVLDEQIVYNQLDNDEEAVWSLLLASGYLKVVSHESYEDNDLTYDFSEPKYELTLTNLEVKKMFRTMIRGWFGKEKSNYNAFIKALLFGDVKAMNIYMNKVAMSMFSYFDTGKNPSGEEPERFYHGFVLGLMVELAERYVLTSNRESGFGRYDVMLEPRRAEDDGIIIEFKVQDAEEEKELADTVKAALKQIEDRKYETAFVSKGIPREKIRKYGFAFCGKKVLIGKGGVCCRP